MSRAQGWEAGPNMLGKVMGEMRQAFMGPGARAAARRREVTMGLEERRRESQAFALTNQGRGLSRVGRAFIP